MLVQFPRGMTPDVSSDWGMFALMQTANNYSQNPVTILSNATSNVLTATQVVGNGLLLRTGAPGSAVSDQLPTAVAMIGVMKGPVNIPLDGSYSEPLRILNFTGQTITLTTNTGLTLSGTMTIADGTWRDFMLTPTTATAITVQNVGAGEADSSAVFTNLTVTGNLTVGGNTTMGGTLSVTGNTSLSNATLSGTLGVTGATTLTSLTASGAVTFSALTANSFLFSGVGGLLTTTAAPTNGQLLIGSTGVAPVAAALTGTANQVVVTNGAGSITLSAPQDIAPASSPTFTAITLSGLTASSFIYSGATKQIASTAAPTNGQLLIGSTGAVPVAAALTGTANQVTVTNGAGSITLALPQSIATSSSPTFASETLSGNLIFSGTANRITGDFSETATLNNNVMFQSSSANTQTMLGLIPNGTALISQYRANNNADAANCGFLQLRADSTATSIASAAVGTGTVVPLIVQIGSTNSVKIDTSGNFMTGPSFNPNPIASRTNNIALDPNGVFLIRTASNQSGFGVDSTSGVHFAFYTDNGSTNITAGNISSNGTNTTYTTASDYRLKENIVPLRGALDRINALPVYRFNFINYPDVCDGCLAHEAAEIVPGAVVGAKDAIDDTGAPVYQTVDYSFFVPLLLAGIQELSSQLADLKASR